MSRRVDRKWCIWEMGCIDTVRQTKEDRHWWNSVLNVNWSLPTRSSYYTIGTGTLTCLSANSDSGDNMVMLTKVLKLTKRQVNKPLILNLEKLKHGECTQQYQIEVNNRFQQLEK